MDKTERQLTGVIFQLVMQNLQRMWHFQMDELDSDDEEENVALLHMFTSVKEKAIRVENYVEHTVPNYSEQEFKYHFRLNYAAYEALENKLGSELSSSGQNVPAHKQLLTVLWLLGTPDSFKSVGERFNLSKGGVYLCFARIIQLLNKTADVVIKWPSATLKTQIKKGFISYGGLRDVVGAIDDTLIEIKAPREHAHKYQYRKRFYAMHLQAIAIPDLRFINVFTGYPGSVGKTQVFQKSDICKNMISNKNQYFEPGEYILGDTAYPVLSWCIPPYTNREAATHTVIDFNKKHSKTRQVVRKAFALLFGRYRRLRYLHMNKIELTPATILGVCVLHNICLNYPDENFNQQAISEGETFMASQQQRLLESSDIADNEAVADALTSKEGCLFRQHLAQGLVA